MSATVLRRIALGLLAGGIVLVQACPDDNVRSLPEGMGADAREPADATVTRVNDGDSFEVEMSGSRERVRYIGIDALEMTDPRPEIVALAREAAAAHRRLVSGRRVQLEFDRQRRDRYGRLLAYVRVGDTLVNEWLVREGHARAGEYPPNLRHQALLEDAESEARAAKRRMWDGRLDGRPFRRPAEVRP